MGANASSSVENGSKHALSSSEQSKLKNLFEVICSKCIANRSQVFTEEQLMSYAENKLSELLVKQLYIAMRETSTHKSSVDWAAFSATICQLVNDDSEEKHKAIFRLASNGGYIASDRITLVVNEFIQAYMTILRTMSKLPDWIMKCEEDSVTKFTQYLLHDLFHKGRRMKDWKGIEQRADKFSFDDTEKWFTQCPIFNVIIQEVIGSAFPFKNTAEANEDVQQGTVTVPNLINPKGKLKNCILDVPSIVMLNSRLPNELRMEWTLLFTSTKDGQSFSTLVQHIKNQGPSLVVVKDKNSNCFGGFASDSWDLNPKFRGNDRSFLFSLHPFMGIYESTGYNDHFMYLNTQQETLPNGLGMGGQFEYFGFWVDSNYGVGKCSPSCTTFESPMLSSSENFKIDVIEVWRVGPKPKSENEDEDEHSSILDKDPEAKAMLLLIGKAPHSEGLREQDSTADIPEEKQLSPT